MITGEMLLSLRRASGRTQTDVAAEVGIPASVLSAYERQRRQPGIEIAGRIIAALGYRLLTVRLLDPDVQARRLCDVVELAEALPWRPRPLATARR